MSATALPIMTLKPPSGFVYNKRPEGWKLLEEGCQVEGDPALELASFLLKGEYRVNGEVMRTRSLEMGGRTGQHHAERVLSQAEDIPTEWRQFYLVFPDTLWWRSDGGLCVPCLLRRVDLWALYFPCVDDDWRGYFRVVRLRK